MCLRRAILVLALGGLAPVACSADPDFEDGASGASTGASSTSGVGAVTSSSAATTSSAGGGDDGTSSGAAGGDGSGGDGGQGGGDGGGPGDGGGGVGGAASCRDECPPGTRCDETDGACQPCPLWTRRFDQNVFSVLASDDESLVYAVTYRGAIEQLDACTGETIEDVPQSAEAFYLEHAGLAGDRLLTFGELGLNVVRRAYDAPGLAVQGSTNVGPGNEMLTGFASDGGRSAFVVGSNESGADGTGFVWVDGDGICRDNWSDLTIRPTAVIATATDLVYAVKSDGSAASLTRSPIEPCLAGCSCQPVELGETSDVPTGVELYQLARHPAGYLVGAGYEFDGVGSYIALFDEDTLSQIGGVDYTPSDDPRRDLVESIEIVGDELLVGATRNYPVGPGEWLVYDALLGVVDSGQIGTEVVAARSVAGGIVVGGTADATSNDGPGFVARCSRETGCPDL